MTDICKNCGKRKEEHYEGIHKKGKRGKLHCLEWGLRDLDRDSLFEKIKEKKA